MDRPYLLKRRNSLRLRSYDYSWPWWYYVTVCVKERECLLGGIIGDKMHLSQFGEIAAQCWGWLPRQYPYVELDEYVIMPNHLHGIIIINDSPRRGDSRTAPTDMKTKPLGQLIGAFKTTSTKEINRIGGKPGAIFWQRNYYDHIIRNDGDLDRIRQYISNNPLKWELDRENPENSRRDLPTFRDMDA